MKANLWLRKTMACLLAVCMLAGMIPVVALAGFDTANDPYNIIISEKEYAVSPGVVESTVVINDATGNNQNVCHVLEVDLSNPNISLLAGYSGMDPSNWRAEGLTKQAAAAERLGYNVVGGINMNLSFASDEPVGRLVIDGVVYHDTLDSGSTYFVLTKDGKAELRNGSQPLDGNEWQAVTANFGFLVLNGVSQYPEEDHNNAWRAPRTTVGIKADGSVVLFEVDGRQAPYSVGMTMHELAQAMIDMGCVTAVNCDGGGSSTFISEREGSGELTIKNSPSDGAERPTLGSLMVISLAKPTGVFDHASISAPSDLYTPGSEIPFTAVGADSSGTRVDLPEGLVWALDASSADLGAIDPATGVFTAADQAGKVTVNLMNGDAVVGSTTIELAVPDEILFASDEVSLGFSDTSDLGLIVRNKGRDVTHKDGDIIWSMSDDRLGTIKDNLFTSSDADTLNGTVTATSAFNAEMTATVSLVIGKLPVVCYDFEDRVDPETGEIIKAEDYYTIDTEGSRFYTGNHGRGEKQSAELVNIKDDEPVRFGSHSLKLNYDFTCGGSKSLGAYFRTHEGFTIPGAPTAIGVWVYAPEGTGIKWEGGDSQAGLWFRGIYGNSKGTEYVEFTKEPKAVAPGEQPGIWWDGWHYCEATLSGNDPYDISRTIFCILQVPNIKMGLQTTGSIYFDNLQFIYGANIDDVDQPIISSMTANGREIVANEVFKTDTFDFASMYADVYNKYTSGIDPETVRMYIDGVNVTNNEDYQFGSDLDGTRCELNHVKLINGTHSLTVAVCDKFGNETVETRYFIVDVDAEQPTHVTVLPTKNAAVLGSEVTIEIRATATDVDKASVTLRLNKQFPDYEIIFADAYQGNVTYSNLNGTFTVNAERKAEVENTDTLIASIRIQVPSDLTERAVFEYLLKSGTFDIAGKRYTFSAAEATLPVVAPYTILPEPVYVGFPTTLKVVTAEGVPTAGVTVYMADGSDAVLGVSDEKGEIHTDAFSQMAKKYLVYARDAEGRISFRTNVNSYTAKGEANGLPYGLKYNATIHPTTEKSITWMSSPLDAAPQMVRYRAEYETEYRIADAETMLGLFTIGENCATNVNGAVLTGLNPDTVYCYQVGNGTVWSEEHAFRTLPEKTDSTNFFVLGDVQAADATKVAAMLRLAATENPVFGIQTGDGVDDAARYQYWLDVIEIFGIENIPSSDMIQVMGNHEYTGNESGSYADAFFNLPNHEPGGYYSVTYGNVYVAVVNYTGIDSELTEAMDWLVQDAAKSDAAWKVLTLHQPPYYTNPHGGNTHIRDYVSPAAEKADIDFVFSGHDHSYARTAPMTEGQVDEENGIVYFICGSSGEKSYDIVLNDEFNFRKTCGDYTAIYLSVTATRFGIDISVYDVMDDGTAILLDSYSKQRPKCAEEDHVWVLDEATGMMECSKCGETKAFAGYSGFVTIDGELAYAINGELKGGNWANDGENWYYFDRNTKRAVDGTRTIGGFTYRFENHVLVEGQWCRNSSGKLYYMWAGSRHPRGWDTINGKTYFFYATKYAAVGQVALVESSGAQPKYCEFDENGVFIQQYMDGPIVFQGEKMYMKDGAPYNYGLVEENGKFYYYGHDGKVVLGGKHYLPEDKMNGLLPGGVYEITAEGCLILVNGIVEENGELYYYENSQRVQKGLVKSGDNYYYFGRQFKAVKDGKFDLPEELMNGYFPGGVYPFDAEGHLILKNGVFEEDGELYYYEDSQRVAKGLVEYNGNYYFFGLKKKAIRDGRFDLREDKMNGLLPAGVYDFDAEGRMIFEAGIVRENGHIYYYEKGQRVAKGLVLDGDVYYYFGRSLKAMKNGTYYLPEEKMNGLLPAGDYTFDAEGRLVLKNGVFREDGELYYYENSQRVEKGLVEFEGSYYYFGSHKKAIRNGRFDLRTPMMNGLLPGGVYDFDAEGRMVFEAGIVRENGNIYYYEKGQRVDKGLVLDGDVYYYFGRSMKALKNGTFYLPEEKMNGLMPGGDYTFDAEGHMVLKNGVFEEDGELYFYENSQRVAKGLVEYEGNYYFFGLKYKALRNGTFELRDDKMNGLLPAGVYHFDEAGHLILN